MSVVVVDLDRTQLAACQDEVIEVYAEAMEVHAEGARSRRGILASHLSCSGLRAVAAIDGERLVGIAYGYVGSPGQWWHDQVRAALSAPVAASWLDGAFEVCELHVRPAYQGTGLGRRLVSQLLAAVDTRTAVLTTPDRETRARRFYRCGGWVDLVRDLHFPGDPRPFAVLGLPLESAAS